jgi:EmrB/QacA subfamily drug resistance transporter
MSSPTESVSLSRRRAITAGLLLGMTLAALEATVVSTAMPTVVATLGGLAHYSWVFSAYLLTSTASVPIWGRLADLYGRRRMYLLGVLVFLVGSVLSGMAGSMIQLVVFRAIQGLGAGAIIPLSLTIIGELYSLQERARAQALFSGVWGVASVAGPIVGGYVTDALSWRWVFYLNLPFGVPALIVVALAYPPKPAAKGVRVDWLGAALLFATVTVLLVALSDATTATTPWLIATAVLLMAFIIAERRTSEPILPLDLLLDGLIARSLLVAFLLGTVMLGAIAYGPLFVQGVMGGTATAAGQVLTPLFLGWVTTSVVAARLTVRVGYRRVVASGALLLTIGFGVLSTVTSETSRATLLSAMLVLGCGLGLSLLALLLAIQHGVDRSRLGVATSLNQFARSMGSAVGVAIMGALLAREIQGTMSADVHQMSASIVRLEGEARNRFALALGHVFAAGAAMSAVALLASFFLPAVDLSHGVPAGAGEAMLAAEMANLDPEDEPVAVAD